MLDELILVGDNNSNAVNSIPALKKGYDDLKIKRSEIKDTALLQESIITGHATQKRLGKDLCVQKVLLVSKSLTALGYVIVDNPMVEQMKTSASQLKRMRASKLVLFAWNLFNTATIHAAALVDYGIEAADLVDLKDTITKYELLIPEPKEARDIRKGCTAKLKVLRKETISLLKQVMDPLVVVLDDTYDSFKTLYLNARTIIDRRGKRRKEAPMVGTGILSGTVTNCEDNSTIEDATVTLDEAGLSITTDEEGVYYFENVPAGTYTVKVEAATYLSQSVQNVEILPGSEANQDIALNSDPG
jgi:hypothetical protein